jgi:hypothetical protein
VFHRVRHKEKGSPDFTQASDHALENVRILSVRFILTLKEGFDKIAAFARSGFIDP